MKIQLKHLTKKFKDVVAVQDVNCTIENGEMVCLLGPSGCGKSTTLAMIAGLEMPTEGAIYFDGQVDLKQSIETSEWFSRTMHYIHI